MVTVKRSRFRLGLRAKRWLTAYIFLAIPLLFFLSIRLLPALFAFEVSLHQWDILSPDRPFVGLANYQALAHDEVFKKALLNTFVYVLAGVPAQLALGLVIALLIQRANRFAGLFRMIYFMPYVTSAVAVSWVWRWMFLPHSGVINNLLGKIGLPQQPFLYSPDQAIYAIITTIVWQGLGFQMIIFLAGLEMIPPVYYEAAQIDGANGWQRFRYITLPLLNPVIVFSAVMATLRFLQTFTEVMNMSSQGEGGPLNSTISLVLYIYQLAFRSFRMGYASAATVVLFVIILAITLIQMKVLTKRFEY